MPNSLWCQSDPIIKFKYEQRVARIRIIVSSQDAPEQPPSEPILMHLTYPDGVEAKVLKDNNDPRLPVQFDMDPYGPNGSEQQMRCKVGVELPSELADAHITVTVFNGHNETIAEIVMYGTMPMQQKFVVNMVKETSELEVHRDSSTWS